MNKMVGDTTTTQKGMDGDGSNPENFQHFANKIITDIRNVTADLHTLDDKFKLMTDFIGAFGGFTAFSNCTIFRKDYVIFLNTFCYSFMDPFSN